MKGTIGLIAIWIFSVSYAFGQTNVTADVIITDALQERNEVSFSNPALTWDDFKGKPDKHSEWTAMTYSGIKLRYEYKHHKDNYTVKILLYPYMDKTRSWYTDAGHNNYTLAHEQRHFDITILITKQLAEKMRSMEYSPHNFAKQINNVHDEYLEKLRQMQDDYDEETRHGINKYKQRIWDRRIESELRKLE